MSAEPLFARHIAGSDLYLFARRMGYDLHLYTSLCMWCMYGAKRQTGRETRRETGTEGRRGRRKECGMVFTALVVFGRIYAPVCIYIYVPGVSFTSRHRLFVVLWSMLWFWPALAWTLTVSRDIGQPSLDVEPDAPGRRTLSRRKPHANGFSLDNVRLRFVRDSSWDCHDRVIESDAPGRHTLYTQQRPVFHGWLLGVKTRVVVGCTICVPCFTGGCWVYNVRLRFVHDSRHVDDSLKALTLLPLFLSFFWLSPLLRFILISFINACSFVYVT